MASKLDVLDQENRKKNIILSGLNLKTFSSVVQGSDHNAQVDPQPEEKATMMEKVIKFASKNNVTIHKDDIESVIPLRYRSFKPGNPQRTLIRFRSQEVQQRFYEMRFNLKQTFPDTYITEDLTKNNAELFKMARDLRKGKKVLSTWTKNCVIYVKTMPSTTRPSRYVSIKCKDDIYKLQN